MSEEIAQVETVSDQQALAESVLNMSKGDLAIYSSIKGDSFETKLELTSAIQNSAPIDEHLGKKIALTNFVIQPVEIVDPETGEVSHAPRVTLIDKDGNSFHGTSVALMGEIERLIGLLGEPHEWPHPVNVVVTKQKSRKGFSFFSMAVSVK